MPVKDDLGTRMKEQYEKKPRTYLERKVPVAIRIDGKAFHTFTKGFNRPFDDILISSMQETTKYLCEHVQGCVLGYTQSDEITLILIDYQNENSDAWFEYQVQKICSISASMATAYFNKIFSEKVYDYEHEYYEAWNHSTQEEKYMNALHKAVDNLAMFDARCFNIPVEEVTNLIYWRQLDARRNSIQMVGQTYFSAKQLHGKTCDDIRDMLKSECSIVWEEFENYKKWGSCCIKHKINKTTADNQNIVRNVWTIDKRIPIFVKEDRHYIDDLICVGNWNVTEGASE